MRLPPDVTRCHKTGNLIFEKRWPKAVLHLAPTRKAFRRSLGTPDVTFADERRAEAKREFMAKVGELRGHLARTTGTPEGTRPSITASVLIGVVEHWRETERRRRFQAALQDALDAEAGEKFHLEVRLAGACGTQPSMTDPGYDLWSEANFAAVERFVSELCRRAEISITAKEDAYWIMSHMVSEAWKAVLEDENRWRRFDLSHLPPSEAPPLRLSKPLSVVYDRFVAEKGYSGTIVREHRTTFRRFREVIGGDLSMRQITRQHIGDFKRACFKLPKVLPREWRDRPMPEIVKNFEGRDVERLDIATVIKHVGFLHTFFSWAARQGEIGENIAAGMVPSMPKARGRMKNRRRQSFSPADVTRFFTSPLFTGAKSPHRLIEPGSHLLWDERFWIPILAPHTGASTSELGWLERKDLKNEDGIWYLDITSVSDEEDPEEERALKAEARHRKMPLHPTVLSLGFVDYVHSLPKSTTRIFPRMKADKEGRISKVFSQNMSRYLRGIGITDRRKVFYSLRHLFKELLRNKTKVPDYIQAALMGHAEAGSGGDYGGAVDLALRDETIRKIVVPGFPSNMRRFVQPTNSSSVRPFRRHGARFGYHTNDT
jgi:integrase